MLCVFNRENVMKTSLLWEWKRQRVKSWHNWNQWEICHWLQWHQDLSAHGHEEYDLVYHIIFNRVSGQLVVWLTLNMGCACSKCSEYLGRMAPERQPCPSQINTFSTLFRTAFPVEASLSMSVPSFLQVVWWERECCSMSCTLATLGHAHDSLSSFIYKQLS